MTANGPDRNRNDRSPHNAGPPAPDETDLVRILSHDLRTPLQVAEGRLALAEEDLNQEHLRAARRALERMDELIEDALHLASEETWIKEIEPVDLGEVARRSWENVPHEDAQLTVETTGILAADRSRLQQMLENLFSNSVIHGGSCVTVTITLQSDPDGFIVSDTGGGIDPNLRETVFDPSFSTFSGGMGYGLSIVYRIATAHGWTVDVCERNEGGARFEFTGVDVRDHG